MSTPVEAKQIVEAMPADGPRVSFARKQIIREETEVTITLDEQTAIDLVALASLVRRRHGTACARFNDVGEAVNDALMTAGVMVPTPEQRFAGTSLLSLGLTAPEPPPVVVHVPVDENGASGPEIVKGVIPKFT